MLSIATDYLSDRDDPVRFLRRIAQAGFSHVHWCHEWNTDRLYAEAEIASYDRILAELRLGVLDLHASSGQKTSYGAMTQAERRAGVELVENRIRMAAQLSADAVVLHLPEPSSGQSGQALLDQVRRSLDELLPVAGRLGVRIAFENMAGDDFAAIGTLLGAYDPEFLGLCYDAGHGNLSGGGGPRRLELFLDRLVSVHLHDNDGTADQHRLPLSGTVDWNSIAALIRRSSYRKCPNLEVSMRNSGYSDEGAFLAAALGVGTRLSASLRR